MHLHVRSPRFLVLSVVALVVMICFSPRRASADAIVTYMGSTYDIGVTPSETFSSDSSALMNTPWWGDQAAAVYFAQQVGGSLNFPNTGVNAGPLFAYDTGCDQFAGCGVSDFFAEGYTSTSGVQEVSNSVGGFPQVWATATLVPEPGTITLLFAGLLALGLLAGVKRYRGNGLPIQV